VKENDNEKFKLEYRLSEFILFGHDRYQALSADTVESPIYQMQQWGEGKLKPQFIIDNINPDQGTAEARSWTAIDNDWKATLVSLLRAKDDAEFNQLLEAHKAFRSDNNWDKIVEIYNEKMQKNREKLGQ